MPQNLKRVNIIRNKDVSKGYRGFFSHVLYVEAVAESYIHIGSGSIKPLFDLNKVKDVSMDELEKLTSELKFLENVLPSRSGNYYIPGSSLKGAIRSRAELMFKNQAGEVPACFIVYNPREEPKEAHLRIWGDVIFENRFKCDAGRFSRVCEVCDIFGAPSLLSKVSFGDLIPVDSDPVEIVEIYNVPQMIFRKGTKFRGIIQFGGLENYQIGLLLHAMRVLDNKPILIGRYKYKKVKIEGREKYFGRLKFSITKIEPDNIDISEALSAFKEKLGSFYREDLDETAW